MQTEEAHYHVSFLKHQQGSALSLRGFVLNRYFFFAFLCGFFAPRLRSLINGTKFDRRRWPKVGFTWM